MWRTRIHSHPKCQERLPAPHVALPQVLCCMRDCSQAYAPYLPWRTVVMEGQHGLAPSPRGTFRSGFQHGAGDGGCIHMCQVPL